MLDVFNNDAFKTLSLTQAINMLPYKPSRIGSMGLFKTKSISTLVAMIEEKQGKLMLIPTAARGTMSNAASGPTRQARPFAVPHIPLNDAITAEDVQGVRAFGSETQLETVAKLVNDRLTAMRESFEVTHEYHRIGAIQGRVVDADGSSVLYNLFNEFGITETVIEFELDVSATEIKLKCLEVIRAMEDALGATPYSQIRGICGNAFFDALITHDEIKTAYDRYKESAFFREQQRDGFLFGEIMWENYRGKVGDINFIPTNVCRFVAEGVPDLFTEIYAPADFMETVNTMGKPVYAKQERQKFDKGVDLHCQSNPLFICNRPKTLIKGVQTSVPGSSSGSGSGSGSA